MDHGRIFGAAGCFALAAISFKSSQVLYNDFLNMLAAENPDTSLVHRRESLPPPYIDRIKSEDTKDKVDRAFNDAFGSIGTLVASSYLTALGVNLATSRRRYATEREHSSQGLDNS